METASLEPAFQERPVMDLKQLKAAMDAALEALKKDPENAELKAAAEEAKNAYAEALAAQGEEGDTENDVDDSGLDDKTKAYIAKLRKENGKHRTAAKELKSKLSASEEQKKAILKAAGIEVEDSDPAEVLKTAQAESQTLSFRNAILESAIQHGIPGDSVDYYSFLVTESVNRLEDGDELTDEQLAEIVQKVKRVGGAGKANTSVNGGKGGKDGSGNPPPPGTKKEVTIAKFVKMSISEKSALYTENRELYESLVAEAKSKNILV